MKDFTSSIRQMNVRRVGGILPMRHHITIAIHGEQLLRAIFIRLRTLALAVTSHLRLMKAGDHLLIREIVEVFEDQKTSHQADRFGAPTDAGIAARKRYGEPIPGNLSRQKSQPPPRHARRSS